MAELASNDHRWGLILAGGDGVRLRALTRSISGDDRPKQFAPLLAGKTLLGQTRSRVSGQIPRARTMFVLTKAHEPFYSEELGSVPDVRKIVQPCNRGTLPAILWSLLRILRLDSSATVAFFPSDHYYTAEKEFMARISSAFDHAEADPESVILLGAVATHAETQYGWIEPEYPSGATCSPTRPCARVKRFWEKPSGDIAQALLERGCLWNTFVMVGAARAFAAMIRQSTPALYKRFEVILSQPDVMAENESMTRVYEGLGAADFSKDVLSANTDKLLVSSLGDIGWNDLGDPQRLITTLYESGIDNPWVVSGACSHCGTTLNASA